MNDKSPIDPQSLHAMRRSCSHLMAAAVDQLWPRAKFGVGPAIDNGFFYDIELPETFSSRISRRSSSRCASSRTRGCRSSVWSWRPTRRSRSWRSSASVTRSSFWAFSKRRARLRSPRIPAMMQSAEGAGGVPTVSLYQSGDFVDPVARPHVRHAGEISHFKLIRLVHGSTDYLEGREPFLRFVHLLVELGEVRQRERSCGIPRCPSGRSSSHGASSP
jgi:threonyl-tRNA synthetase